MKDDLGDRMKRDYESRTRYFLPRRTYTLIRIDGKAFHTYTRNCARPYDVDLMAAMDAAAIGVCIEAQGAQFAFVQSDEISILLTDFGKREDRSLVRRQSSEARVDLGKPRDGSLQRGADSWWRNESNRCVRCPSLDHSNANRGV